MDHVVLRHHLLHRAAPARWSSNPNAIVFIHHVFRPSFPGRLPFKTTNLTTLCYATTPGSSDPPPGNNKSDVGATFSKAQDKMQIFLAVLFWMSLFFWNCALDGKNDDGPNIKSRFKR